MIGQFIFLSMVTASISFTISESRIFTEFRSFMHDKSQLLGELFSCGYCLSHWVAFLLVGLYQFNIFNQIFIIDYFFTALAISWVSAFQWISMCWILDKLDK